MLDFEAVNIKVAKQPIVIFVRFSHLHETAHAFRKGKGQSLEERVNIVFNENRLRMRFEYFENICLPSLDSQTSKNFVVVLRCSDLLPQKWKDRLLELVSERDYIYTLFLSTSEKPIPIEKKLLTERLLSDGADAVITARLDDDDALAENYVERLGRYLSPFYRGHGISFSKGYYLSILDKGTERRFKLVPTRRVNLAVGLAYVSDRNIAPYFIMNFAVNHLLFDTAVPVIVDSTQPTFIVTSHESNDTNRSQFKEMVEAVEINRDTLYETLGPGLSSLKIENISPQ